MPLDEILEDLREIYGIGHLERLYINSNDKSIWYQPIMLFPPEPIRSNLEKEIFDLETMGYRD